MNSKERFAAVLENGKPDRLPLFIPAVACSVASKILGYDAHTGGDSLHFKEEFSWTLGGHAHEEFVQKYREDVLTLSKKLGVDVVRDVWRQKRIPARRLDEHTLLFGDENGRHTVKRFFPETQSYGIVYSDEGYRDTDEIIKDINAGLRRDNTPSDDEMTEMYGDHLEMMRLAGDEFAVMVTALALPLPMENVAWLETTALEPELLRDHYLHEAEGMAKQVRWLKAQGFRFLSAGCDIASQQGPVLSPNAFGKIVEPALAILAAECSRLGMTYCYRSDGNLWSLCDSIFIRAGVQAYGEVDRGASMAVGALREKYPKLILLGNVSSVTLSCGNERQVREEARATMIESGGMNYIAGPSNAIVHGTPVGNVYAMVEEIRNFVNA